MLDRLTEFLWSMASSVPVLAVLFILLVLSTCVGYFPFATWLPVLGQYARAAQFAVLFFLGLFCFLLGIHVDMERHEAVALRSQLAAANADLSIASDAAADAQNENAELTMKGLDDAKRIANYKNALKYRPNSSCTLTPDDFDSVRKRPGRR